MCPTNSVLDSMREIGNVLYWDLGIWVVYLAIGIWVFG